MSATPLERLAARHAAAILPTYGRPPVAFARGEGIHLWDTDGRRYLDFLCGLAVTSLGHAHPGVAEAVAAQARTLVHVSNLYLTEPMVTLAERLQGVLGWPDGKAFFCNSGAEAVEAALKIARRHGKAQSDGKVGVVALHGGFHGRTLGALAATANPAKREPFQPLGDWVTHVAADDPAALRAAVGERTCAVIMEPVQGEGGVFEVPDETWAAAREACDRAGALLIADEVQTGLGRLGAWFGWQQTGVTPDVVTLAKALGNGLPIGAAVARDDAAAALVPGDHGTTFGGGPVVCAAALAVLDALEGEDLVAHAAAMGKALQVRLDALVESHPLVAARRGRGLLQVLALSRPVAAQVVAAALDAGLIVNNVTPDAVRLAPPLVVGEEHLDEMAVMLRGALDQAAGS